jgi:hypothetical protein
VPIRQPMVFRATKMVFSVRAIEVVECLAMAAEGIGVGAVMA